MRLSCIHWFDTATRAITMLRPSRLPVKALVADFPNLQSLDLSSCIKVSCDETGLRPAELSVTSNTFPAVAESERQDTDW